MSFHLFIMILHVLGACFVVGVVVLSLFSIIKPPITKQSADRMSFIGKFGMWASIWQFITGFILAYQDWGEFKSNRIFWIKMILYIVEGTIASQLIMRQAKRVEMQIAKGEQPQGSHLRTSLAIQAILILAITILGVILVSGGNE